MTDKHFNKSKNNKSGENHGDNSEGPLRIKS